MKELIVVTENAVNARDLHKLLGVKHRFRDWISNSIRDYGFIEGKDFSYFFSESVGGRPAKEYAISISMAKELSMVAKTESGKKARLYFIKCEEIARENLLKLKAYRIAGIQARKSLTDVIQESGENERMHGHGHSTFTRLVYSLTGLTNKKKDYGNKSGFRDTLSADELKRVEIAEAMIKPLLEMEKEYSDIKEALTPLFKGE